MRCLNCNSETHYVVYRYRNGRIVCGCNLCEQTLQLSATQPDVYFREPYFDEHLADKDNPHGQYINSKRHKARIMKDLRLKESGDKTHGSRNQEHLK